MKDCPKVKRHPKSTHADSTPATDGKHVIALFGSHGLYAYDLNGKLLWKQDLGVLDAGWFYDPDYQWEYGASPIIYKNMVIVQADIQKNSFIAAYDIKNGKRLWMTPREEIPSWSTPTVYEGKSRAELVTNGTKAIRGYDPVTGKELWRLGPNSEVATPTPIFAHDLIYVTSGYRVIQPIYVIKPGATGDISLKDGKESNEFHCLEQNAGRSLHADAGYLWRLALHRFESGRAYDLPGQDRRARLSGTARRQGRCLHCFTSCFRRKDLPLERRRRRLCRQGWAKVRAAGYKSGRPGDDGDPGNL